MLLLSTLVWAQRDSIPNGYPHSLHADLTSLTAELAQHPDNVPLLLQLSELHLNMGDDLFTENPHRLSAYEAGARHAKQAMALEALNAEAHFLYAANLGNATRLKSYAIGMINIKEILLHVRQALTLDPTHAPAHQMLGGLLAKLPWMLGGDEEKAQHHLEQAIAIDERYTNARLLLAKLFIKQNKQEAARKQLLAVIQATHPHYPYTWTHHFLPEAHNLLSTLDAR
ncbi:MAG: hypothetical protein NPIRA01_08450 [Nitrospirales bacterium]|nr:MAG: hypothetical protein NPIRA01_08450 [Nitrospirales bacterium]